MVEFAMATRMGRLGREEEEGAVGGEGKRRGVGCWAFECRGVGRRGCRVR